MKDGWYEEWRSQQNETNPDSCWSNLVQTISKVAAETFPPETKKEDEYVELARERRQLLKERAQHRQDLRGASEDKAAGLQLELVMVSRRARKMRQAAAKKKQARLIEELWEAWKERNMSLVHRLRVSLSGRGRGPKRRCYYAAVQGAPSMQEWITTLQKPGGAGGMMCELVDWETHTENYN